MGFEPTTLRDQTNIFSMLNKKIVEQTEQTDVFHGSLTRPVVASRDLLVFARSLCMS